MLYLGSTRYITVTLCALLLLFVIWGCGGGGGNLNRPSLDGSNTWPVHGFAEGVRSGSYVVVAVDSTERLVDPVTTRQLRLDVEPTPQGERVRISGMGLPSLDRIYLHLGYDAERMQPAATQCGRELADDTVFLGITNVPGLVCLGLAGRELRQVITGDCVLAEVDFTPGRMPGSRQVAAVTDSVVDDLTFNASIDGQLLWTYRSTGDYNQDSEVGISDVTPIGQYYKAKPASSNWQAAQVADGDTNTEVNISDLTPIGSHYRMRVTAYEIQSGAFPGGPFGVVDTEAFTESNPVLPVGGGFKQFNYTLAAPVDGAWYVVTAVDGFTVATENSNPVQYTGTTDQTAPTGLTAARVTDHIQLTWQAPTGGTPDGYNAYVATDATMTTGLQLINLGLITQTSYDCPIAVDPDAQHFFGVKAYYPTGESTYSNVYDYNPAGDTVPPVWLDAQHTGIKAATPGNGQVTVEWYTATDVSTPLTYLIYYAEAASFDWSTATVVTASESDTEKVIASLTNKVAYRFGVRVKDFFNNTDTNTNTLDATPDDTAPTGLAASLDVDHIQLDWTAPASYTPDGYNAYVANDAAMTDGLQMINLGLIAAVTYDCPLAVDPAAEHYFGVKAHYPAGESAYSNIFHYNPASDTDPPTWEDSLHTGIKSALPADGAVTVEWYTATDASPPITYLIYYDKAITFDWATANVATASESDPNKIITGLDNDVAYRFGVRARDSLGNTDTNTNTIDVMPVSGGVPVDTGVWQASELVDDGGVLTSQDVGWFSDIQAKSDGTVGIAHHNESSGDLMYTERVGAGPWSTTTVSRDGQTGSWPSLAFNPTTGYPCIAYHNEDAAQLEYAEFNGTDWEITIVDSGGDKGAFASLAFDPEDDQPAVAYFDAINQDVRYAKFSDTNWTTKVAYNGTTSTQNLTGAFCSLAFNPVSHDPAVSFMKTYDYGGFPMAACWITVYNGTSWDAEAAIYGPYNDITIDTAGWATSLCFSPTGTAYIITCELMGEVLISDNSSGWDPTQYVSVGNCGALSGGPVEKVYTDIDWADGDIRWVYFDKDGGAIMFGSGYGVGAAIESGGAGGFPALASTPNGDLFASYLSSSGGDLRFAKSTNDGANWTPETAAIGGGGMAVVGERASLAYNPVFNCPVISYYDASHGALKYADKQTGTWRNEIVSDVDNDGSASGCGVDSGGIVYIGYFTVSTSYAALKLASGMYGAWTFDTIVEANLTEGGDVAGNYCALAMNYPPTEAPSIAYHNTSQKRLEFAQGDTGGGFEITTVYEFNDPGRWNAVAFNPANKYAGVATYVRDTQDLYFVQKASTGIPWNPIPVDTSGMVGNHCSLCYGATTARPWISYYDQSNHRLKVAYVKDGGDWSTPTDWKPVDIPAPNGSTDYGVWSSIAWHPQLNRAAVAFFDSDAGKLWYVFIGDPAAPQAAVELAGGANIEGSHCSLMFDPDTHQPAVAYHDVTNGDLRYVERHPN